MGWQNEPRLGHVDRRREAKRAKRDRTRDSPEKVATRPKADVIDKWLNLIGVERKSHFRKK
jgi:hypothetical protein